MNYRKLLTLLVCYLLGMALLLLGFALNPVLAENSAPDNPASPEGPHFGINNSGCVYSALQDAVDASNPGDVIKVTAGSFGVHAEIDSSELTIQGGYDLDCLTHNATTSSLSGNNITNVITVDDSLVTLLDLVIRDGVGSGAGVYVMGTSHVTLDNTDIIENNGVAGGGMYIGSAATVTLTNDSDITKNIASVLGGGVAVYGRLNAIDNMSDIWDNRAPHGGGIYANNSAQVYLNNSDMHENQATAADGKGGAIYAGNGSVITLENTVFIYYGNTAYDGAGIYADHSTIDVSTAIVFQGNDADHHGGAIYLGNGSYLVGTAHIGQVGTGNSNTAIRGAGIYADTSTVELSGNIKNNVAAEAGAGIYADSSTIHLTNVQVGGTESYEPNALTGTSGVFGAGLYLTGNSEAVLINTDVVNNSVWYTPNSAAGIGIYTDFGSDLTMTDSSITLHEANATTTGKGGGLYISESNVTLRGCDILSNTASHEGGGIRMYGTSTLSITASNVVNNRSTSSSGGGLAVTAGSPEVYIVDTDFRNNQAATDGGAIHIASGDLSYIGAWNLRDNKATGDGGAIAIADATSVLVRADAYSMVYNNRAGDMGGFIYLGDNIAIDIRAAVDRSMYIYANMADYGGGAIAADNGGTINLHGRLNFDYNNSIYHDGGAIYLDAASTLNLNPVNGRGQVFWDNRANNGGAIYVNDDSLISCRDAVFGDHSDANIALSGSGGSIHLIGSTLIANNCAFNINHAIVHGGAIAAYASVLDIDTDFTTCDPLTRDCSIFAGNIADWSGMHSGYGGAIYARNTKVTIDHTIFKDNQAEIGGAIFQDGIDADMNLTNALIINNTVKVPSGAGVHSESGGITVTNSTLAHNVGGTGYSQANTTGTVNQTIAWSNTGGGFESTSGIMAGNCNIDQSVVIGIYADPLFVDPGNGDFHLGVGSPAVDVCSSGVTVDLDNITRPEGVNYDIGAYEFVYFDVYLPVSLKQPQ